MDLTALQGFRSTLYTLFERRADALMELTDALLSAQAARSLAEVTLAPAFRRHWPSGYAALHDGRIDHRGWRQLMATTVPRPQQEDRLLLAGDASNIPRPEFSIAADRIHLYVPNLPDATAPLTVGWQYSTLVVVPSVVSSWVWVLDQARIPSAQTPAAVLAAQLQTVIPHLPVDVGRPLLLADRHYASGPFLRALAAVPCDLLLRLPTNRVLFRPAPPPTGKRGAPRKDGTRFACADETSWGAPPTAWEGADSSGHPLRVQAWSHLHFKETRDQDVTVIRIERPHATNRKRDPRVCWLLWRGPTIPPLERVWSWYRCRYGIEHHYRFAKSHLLWTQARVRTPDQFTRWSLLVATVQNLLALAREVVAAHHLPWQSPARPATPAQVRRAMAGILPQLGTPARPPKPRGKSPGRAKGTHITPAPRYAVVIKHPHPPKNRPPKKPPKIA
jgi:DDE superfamily endonuclease